MAAFVLFKAAGQTLALPAPAVLQVLRMALPVPSPGAPPHVRGLLDVRGRLAPVIDVRARLGGPVRPPSPQDLLLLVTAGGRVAALEVDEVLEVVEVPAGAVEEPPPLARTPLVAAALRLPGGVVLVHAPAAWVDGAGAAAGPGGAGAEPP